MTDALVALPEWFELTLPLFLLVTTAMTLFVWDSIYPESEGHLANAAIAIAGILATLGVSVWYLLAGVGAQRRTPELFMDTLVIDTTSLLFTAIVASVTLFVLIGSYEYLDGMSNTGEFYSLVVLAATGMATMAHAGSLVTVFIALELASLPSYALVAFLKRNRGSVEGGMKYFIVGALSSSILVYVATGSLVLTDVAAVITDGTVLDDGILALGVLLVIGGFTFKVAGVPFHFWAPEAYEGAPAPVSALLSSASKAAGFVVAYRVFAEAFPIADLQSMGIDWVLVFGVIAAATMIVGNFAAAVQDNVKRMLAYSAIGHAGYALIGLAALSNPGAHNEAVLGAGMAHLAVYGFMNTGAFMFIALTEHWEIGRTFEDFNGLATRAPIACAAMAVLLFNLAGLPIGGGFWSKYFLFAGAVGNGFVWLAAIGAVTSALSLFYYWRLVKAMWVEEADEPFTFESRPLGLYAAVVGAAVVTVGLLVGFGVLFGFASEAAALLSP